MVGKEVEGWLFSPQWDTLLECRGHLWWKWARIPRRTNHHTALGWFEIRDQCKEALPSDICRVEVFRWKNRASVRSLGFHLPRTNGPEIKSVGDALKAMAKEETTMVDDFWQQGPLHHFRQALSKGEAAAVSDGSFKDGRSSSAFVLQDRLVSPNFSILGVNMVPGAEENQSAFRAELGGIVGIFFALYIAWPPWKGGK